MYFEKLKNQMPDALKDTKINFSRALMEENHILSQTQIAMIALSCSYSLRNPLLTQAAINHFEMNADNPLMNAAAICASLMAMNNVYYRFVHLVEDEKLSAMNPMLRMSGLANHGIDHVDFELASLAVSALNGCGMCMNAHTEKLKKDNVPLEQIQAAIRIAAVLNAVVVGISM